MLVIAAILVALSCGEPEVCRREKGDIIHSVLNNNIGQIINVLAGCSYTVRLSGENFFTTLTMEEEEIYW